MKLNWKGILRYFISILIGVLLLAYLFQGISWESLVSQFQRADYRWFLLSAVFSLLSHLIRAYRWHSLVAPLGYQPKLFHSFLAVMVGYFMNYVIPRAGEITRCGLSSKLDDIPASTAFGTVVLERIVDIVLLLTMTLVLLLVEFENLNQWFYQVVSSKFQIGASLWLIAGLALLMGLAGLWLLYKYHRKLERYTFYQKVQGMFLNVWEGITSIKSVRNIPAFIFQTLLIWLMYYLTSYALFFCFPETAHLDMWFAYIVLITGAFGMAAPVNGGIGAFHLLVAPVFALRGISDTQGVLMATFMHTSQTIVTLSAGGLAFIISAILIQRKRKAQALSKAE